MGERIKDLLKYSRQAVVYMTGEITHICRDMKKRAPASEGEREAAKYMADVLERDCGCSDVRMETFKVHPGSFYGYFYFSTALGLLCVGSFFIRPWLSIVFGILGLLLFLLHFVLYKKPLDPLFPEKESLNVTAVFPCRKEVRQRVFLCGHTDAAWEFPLNYHFGGVAFETPGAASFFGTLYFIMLSVISLLGAGAWTHTVGLCGLIFVPFFILMVFTYNTKVVVDGANDNLSGCYMGITLLSEMKKHGIQPEHTELGVILTGSEEAGTRGAKAWAEAHKNDFKDVSTYILCFDTIHDPRFFMVNRKDLNSTVSADEELCDMFIEASEKAGVLCKSGRVPLFGGSTDSAAFVQGGFRSMCVTALNHVLEDYYHTRRDTYDNMDDGCLENCYKATVMLIDEIDRNR